MRKQIFFQNKAKHFQKQKIKKVNYLDTKNALDSNSQRPTVCILAITT